MTCAECRDHFSARADEALAADDRAALETHLATCAECRREWQRFAATVGLLRSVEPVRAPAGFVDRVLAGARPRPWYRRLARHLFVPWSVKIPLEAAAIVMVGGLAVMIVQRSPEMLEFAAGPEPTATMSQSVEPKSGATTTADELSRDYAARFSAPPAARSPGPDVAAGRDTARGDAGPKAREDRETTPGRTDTSPSEPTRPPLSEEQFQHLLPTRRQQLADEQAVGAAPSARQRVMTAPPAGIAARPAPAAPSTAAPPPPASAAASAAPPTGARGEAPQATSGTERSAELRKKAEALAENTERDRIQALSARVAPESVELRMTVTDRLSVRRDIDTLVTRLGGTLLPRRADTGSVELVVPRESYPALTRELARLGALAIVRQPTELPGSVRVTVSLTE